MITLALSRIALPLAAILVLGSMAVAQQTAAPSAATAPAKPKPTKPAAKPSPSKPAPQAAAVADARPVLLGQYGEWAAYAAHSGGSKVCFTLAKPARSQTTPPNKPRDPVYFFVASRPAENVKNEVSVMFGYAFKPATDATVEIGPAKFAMYTQNDGAWIKNAAEEARLVDTMRKGADLVVSGTSSRGTQSVDRYSLKGLSQALDRAAQECK